MSDCIILPVGLRLDRTQTAVLDRPVERELSLLRLVEEDFTLADEPMPIVQDLPDLLELADPDTGQLWQEQALCAQTDPEAFFPEKGGSTREAKRVCVSCEVRSECLEYALEHDERFGIWGGLSERERRRLKKEAG